MASSHSPTTSTTNTPPGLPLSTINSPPLASPKAIPPRTSSTGVVPPVQPPPRSTLRPLSESDCRSPDSPPNNAANTNTPTTSFTVTMHPPPPPDPNRYAIENINITSKRPWPEEKEKVLNGPYDYLLAQPGKDFRSQLIGAFNALLDVPEESLAIINKVVAMLHTASLLIDDVEDSSSLRRSLPVAHNIFGVPQTINSANYVYFCALRELQKLNNPTAIDIFTEELVSLHRGQGMDLYWRDTLTCPTEDDYLEMVGNKTGGLFRLGIKLMQAESSSPVDCIPLVNVFGLVFQIRDDYLNLSSSEYSHNKGLCEDLTEGKFSFPVIHAIRSDPGNLQLINILGQKTSDVEVKRYAVSYMERTGSFDYTRQVISVLVTRARKLVNEIDAGQGATAGLHAILEKMTV
ncbi:geranylgeranyl pyrophosphate synthetase [Sodiomyces alkalinus F11]|uniref:Geranylgeranyl pyrophosphate synthetase n=1 Tax=Sodiomyces alkalinus (strain CBS 110278 / VKM F-3762 / F11) TaxID=1314773 RepID=A0A3N2PL96_SODAK|nr:geranylgeranyl pyrophosphate synthetase [Sodiomyces alkalinus F11]ROT35311.1 geranylgeranyl pyrophosphate synthetase [Sodiomyces alkalinus F11]